MEADTFLQASYIISAFKATGLYGMICHLGQRPNHVILIESLVFALLIRGNPCLFTRDVPTGGVTPPILQICKNVGQKAVLMAVPFCKRVGNSILCDLFVFWCLGTSLLFIEHLSHGTFFENSAKQYENKLYVLDYEIW